MGKLNTTRLGGYDAHVAFYVVIVLYGLKLTSKGTEINIDREALNEVECGIDYYFLAIFSSALKYLDSSVVL